MERTRGFGIKGAELEEGAWKEVQKDPPRASPFSPQQKASLGTTAPVSLVTVHRGGTTLATGYRHLSLPFLFPAQHAGGTRPFGKGREQVRQCLRTRSCAAGLPLQRVKDGARAFLGD